MKLEKDRINSLDNFVLLIIFESKYFYHLFLCWQTSGMFCGYFINVYPISDISSFICSCCKIGLTFMMSLYRKPVNHSFPSSLNLVPGIFLI